MIAMFLLSCQCMCKATLIRRKTTNNTNVKVGTKIVAKVGCNEVKAVITEIGENGIMARSHKSGKEFRVKTILLVESVSEVIRETPKPEKKLSLSYRIQEAAAAFFVYRKGNNNRFSIVSIIEKMQIFCYFCLTNITDDVILTLVNNYWRCCHERYIA